MVAACSDTETIPSEEKPQFTPMTKALREQVETLVPLIFAT